MFLSFGEVARGAAQVRAAVKHDKSFQAGSIGSVLGENRFRQE
jgi:hypothetical protein